MSQGPRTVACKVVPLFIDPQGRYVWDCPKCQQRQKSRSSRNVHGCKCGEHFRLDVVDRPITDEDRLRGVAYRNSGGRCWLCGGILFVPWTIDHVLAVRNGGRDNVANLQAAHKECNEFKSSLDPKGFREKAQRAIDDAAAFARTDPLRMQPIGEVGEHG